MSERSVLQGKAPERASFLFRILVPTAVLAITSLAAAATPAAAAPCVQRTNIEAIIDDSGSMEVSDPQRLRRGGLEFFIREVTKHTRTLGAVEFGESAASIFKPAPINSARGSMINSLRSHIREDGSSVPGDSGSSTNYNAGFLAAVGDNQFADARIFLTDGDHNEGDYAELHRFGAPVYVVGLGIGKPGSSFDADRLKRIADETVGRYFPDVSGIRIQAVFNTISAIIGCRPIPHSIYYPNLSDRGDTVVRPFRPSKKAKGVNLTLNWQYSRNSLKIAGVTAVGKKGAKLATLTGKGRPGKLAFNHTRGRTFDSITVKRSPRYAKLRVRVRAKKVKLTERPLLQASNLPSVKGLKLRRARGPRKSKALNKWPARSAWTVILASQRKKADARKYARRGVKQGLKKVGLLKSSRHKSLRPGYWVAFSGVLPSARKAEVNRKRARKAGFKDAYVRFISRR